MLLVRGGPPAEPTACRRSVAEVSGDAIKDHGEVSSSWRVNLLKEELREGVRVVHDPGGQVVHASSH
jgi:hypothetical protein